MKKNLSVATSAIFAAALLTTTITHSAVDDQAAANAYVAIRMIKMIYTDCKNQNYRVDENAYKKWLTRNNVAQLEPLVDSTLNPDKTNTEKLNAIEQKIARSIPKISRDSCNSFGKMTELQETNPLQQYPQLANDVKSGTAPTASLNLPAATPIPAEEAPASNRRENENHFNADHAKRTAASIEEVLFDHLDSETVPLMLFKDGSACMDMSLLVEYSDAESHRKKNPRTWFKWRRQSDKFQLFRYGNWKNIEFQQPAQPFPANYKLDRYYHYLTTSGGGYNSAYSDAAFKFFPDGSFTDSRVMAANTNSSVNDSSGFASSKAKSSGRYWLDGYLLRLEYHNKKIVHYAIATDDLKDPAVIWLDGHGYVSK